MKCITESQQRYSSEGISAPTAPMRRTPRHSLRRRHARGMSKWGWLAAVLLLVGVMTAVLRLGPHYIDYRVVQSVLDRLPEKQVHGEMSRAKIREHFSKQFKVEGFRVPLKEMLVIERTREETIITIDYEIREHLFYNVDAVLKFGEQRKFE